MGVSKCDGEITVHEWHYIQFKKSVKSNKAVMTNEFLHEANLVAFVILLLASSKTWKVEDDPDVLYFLLCDLHNQSEIPNITHNEHALTSAQICCVARYFFVTGC